MNQNINYFFSPEIRTVDHNRDKIDKTKQASWIDDRSDRLAVDNPSQSLD